MAGIPNEMASQSNGHGFDHGRSFQGLSLRAFYLSIPNCLFLSGVIEESRPQAPWVLSEGTHFTPGACHIGTGV